MAESQVARAKSILADSPQLVPDPVMPSVGDPPIARCRVCGSDDLEPGQNGSSEPELKSKRFLPASMTKAMSALIAFDLIRAGKLREDAVFTVLPETAARWAGKGTTLNLRAGEQVRVGNLLMGLTTVSANDAAVVLAEGALGSNEAWLAAMNARARALGMNGSHFATPNGFPDRGQTYVTARDLMRLANALIGEHPQLYRRYFGHPAMDWRGARLTSHDPFAGGVLPGADGIKTGHTFEAGFNFLGAVERGGRRLVLVVAGVWSEPQRAAAAKALAEWGYAAWDSRPLGDAGMVVGQARVQQGDARRVPLALPRKFTLSQIQRVYEAVLERALDKRNFRKKLMATGVLRELDETQQGVAHRAGRLYQFDAREYRARVKQGFHFDM